MTRLRYQDQKRSLAVQKREQKKMPIQILMRLLLLVGCGASSAAAQGVMTVIPSLSLGSGLSEHMSGGGSFTGPNWFANLNNQVASPLGSHLSNSGLSGGYRFVGGGVSGGINFQFAQGSSRSISGTSQSMTTAHGYPGHFFSGQVRPFVTGITPVVGAYPTADPTLHQLAAADWQAKRASIAQATAARENGHLRSYLLRAERAEAVGDLRMARANYRFAARLAAEPLRSAIQSVLRERLTAERGTRAAK